jgi:hypothetical protein
MIPQAGDAKMAGNVGRSELADAWDRRLARFAECGQTVAKFCASERVSVAAFYYHRQKQRELATREHASPDARVAKRGDRPTSRVGRGEQAGGTSAFRQVHVTNGPAAPTSVTVRLPCGAEVSFAPHPDLVRQVFDQLLGFASSRTGGRTC